MSQASTGSKQSGSAGSTTTAAGGSGADDNRVSELLTFALVPLVSIGATWLYDSYMRTSSSSKSSSSSRFSKSRGSAGSAGALSGHGALQKGDMTRTGSFEDIMRGGSGESMDQSNDGSLEGGSGRGPKRRSSSSFFLDESEHGDPKGKESRANARELAVSYKSGDGNGNGSGNGSGSRNNTTTDDSSGDGEGPEAGLFDGGVYRRLESPFHGAHPERAAGIKEGNWTSLGLEQPLVVAMVGLPARGKSYVVKMIIRFLSWSGFECQVFNVGSHRRKMGLVGADSNFFDDNNSANAAMREEMAMAVQNEMYMWLHESMSKRRVAFFDATNTTVERRHALVARARSESTFLLFIESICDDEKTLQRNYDLKLLNEDYSQMDPGKAREDFMKRVEMYTKVYETIVDTEDNGALSYIKMINVGQKMITRNCSGYVPSQISFYLQNVHIVPRKIFLSLTSMNRLGTSDEATFSLQHGESANLTNEGRVYSRSLALFCENQRDTVDVCADLLVLSGASRVHAETLFHLRQLFSCYSTPLLNEMRGGDLHGLSRADIKRKYPQEYQKRAADKLHYRFPGVGGESYLDIIERVRPVIIELERQRRSVLSVCHIAVLRCIYAYLMGTIQEDIPYLQFKAHHVYELTPGPFGCRCVVHDLSSGRYREDDKGVQNTQDVGAGGVM